MTRSTELRFEDSVMAELMSWFQRPSRALNSNTWGFGKKFHVGSMIKTIWCLREGTGQCQEILCNPYLLSSAKRDFLPSSPRFVIAPLCCDGH